jgi:hypothetical protein
LFYIGSRVARWHIFKPPIWFNFEGSSKVRCWYILWLFGRFYGHLVYDHLLYFWYIVPRKIWQPWSGAAPIQYVLAEKWPECRLASFPETVTGRRRRRSTSRRGRWWPRGRNRTSSTFGTCPTKSLRRPSRSTSRLKIKQQQFWTKFNLKTKGVS